MFDTINFSIFAAVNTQEMKILVTGSEGFIGKELVRTLHSMGHTVIGCDRKSLQEVSAIAKCNQSYALNGIKAVVHLAAQTSVFNNDIRQIEEDNILTFMDIVDFSNANGCRLVYASSSCAANITSLYGLSKRFDEEFAAIYARNAVGVRFHNVYGPNQREGTLLAVAMDCMAKGKPIKLYNNGKNLRHFTYIDDIVRGIVWLLPRDTKGIVNICSPEETSTLEFIEELQNYVPVKYELTDEIRNFDKELQHVDHEKDLKAIEYTRLKAGLYKAMAKWNVD